MSGADRQREIAPGSRAWRENIESLQRRHDQLDKEIRGVEAIGEQPPSLNWKRKERSALAWAIGKLNQSGELTGN
jgi:hypothetical protein